MDVGADRAVRGRAGGLLRRLGEPPLAQQTERAVEVAGRLAERLLAVEEPRPRLLPELLDEGEAHACVASTSCPRASARRPSTPTLVAASSSLLAIRCRSS